MASITFNEALTFAKVDSHTYRINLDDSFGIRTVPNGGYTASCMLAAAKAHLSSRDQPDTLTAHFEYPSTTAAGPAILIIEDIKLGRQISRLHLTLYQGGLLTQKPWISPSISRRTVLAYTIHTNLSITEGITVPTGYQADPANALPPLPDFGRLKSGDGNGDEKWERGELPRYAAHMRSLHKWNFYMPRDGPLSPGVLDMWMCFSSGERITQSALAYVVDSFPYNLHTFLAAPELRELMASEPPERPNDATGSDQRSDMWLPTVALNLEVKMVLPAEGVDWLAMRVTSKQIQDGIFDLDVLIRNVEGEIVALSHHVAMIVMVQRNGQVAKAVL